LGRQRAHARSFLPKHGTTERKRMVHEDAFHHHPSELTGGKEDQASLAKLSSRFDYLLIHPSDIPWTFSSRGHLQLETSTLYYYERRPDQINSPVSNETMRPKNQGSNPSFAVRMWVEKYRIKLAQSLHLDLILGSRLLSSRPSQQSQGQVECIFRPAIKRRLTGTAQYCTTHQQITFRDDTGSLDVIMWTENVGSELPSFARADPDPRCMRWNFVADVWF
jgi:hypothetical protein